MSDCYNNLHKSHRAEYRRPAAGAVAWEGDCLKTGRESFYILFNLRLALFSAAGLWKILEGLGRQFENKTNQKTKTNKPKKREKTKTVLLIAGGVSPCQQLRMRGSLGLLPPLECPFAMADS